jgi:tetratricopeptide (TPR) repeat protein
MPPAPTRTSKDILDEAKSLMDLGEWKKAVDSLQPFLTKNTGDMAAKPAIAKGYFLRAQALVHMAELSKAFEDCCQAQILAKEVMDQSTEGEALRLMGNISWKRADYKKAHEYLLKAHELAKNTKNLRLEGMVHLELGTTYSNTSDLDTADREYREAILALERVGDARELGRAYNNFANNFVYLKKFDKAAEMFAKTKKMAEKAGDQSLAAWGAFNRAECLVELGATKEAMLELEWALPILEKIGDNYGVVGAVQIYGLAYAKMEDWENAEKFLKRARDMANKNGMPVSEAKVIRDQGRMYSWMGDKDKAAQFFKEARDIFEKQGSKREQLRVEADIKELAQGSL